MGIIWIRCPATRRKVPTGIQTDASSLEEFPSQLKKARCPICGMRHMWEDDDAWITREIEPARVGFQGTVLPPQ